MNRDVLPARPIRGLLAQLVFPFFRQHWLRLLGGLVALLGVDFFQLLVPRFVKKTVDALAVHGATPWFLATTGLTILALALGIAVLRFAWRTLVIGFSRIMETAVRDRLYRHLLSLDREFYRKHTVGSLMALGSNDLAAVQLAFGIGLVAAVDSLVMTAAAISFMAWIHPWLLAIAILPLPFLAFLTKILSQRLHLHFNRAQERFEALTEFARTTISSIRLVKACTLEQSQTERFNTLGEKYVHDNIQVARVQGVLFPVSGLISQISMMVVLVLGGHFVVQDEITIGDFTAFLAYLAMLTWPMMAVGWVANLFQRGMTSLARLRNILEQEPGLRSPIHPAIFPQQIDNIAIRDLTFSYFPGDPPALDRLSLEITPGVLGVVGPTGAGKSTLCRMLLRLYSVPDNTLFWNGVDVNSLSIVELRSRISYVPQETVIFSDTIRANIAMGNPQVDEDHIEQAATWAAMHEEIGAMPDGYDTVVGERGVTLSGGQRQRIALARALLLDRPVVVIDDGLSAVDMETEEKIVANLSRVLAGRIAILVSHRVAALAPADEIVVMDKGRVVDRGSSGQLLQTSRFFQKIYHFQDTAGPGGKAVPL